MMVVVVGHTEEGESQHRAETNKNGSKIPGPERQKLQEKEVHDRIFHPGVVEPAFDPSQSKKRGECDRMRLYDQSADGDGKSNLYIQGCFF